MDFKMGVEFLKWQSETPASRRNKSNGTTLYEHSAFDSTFDAAKHPLTFAKEPVSCLAQRSYYMRQ